MNFEDVREYCIQKHFVTETDPFGPQTIVYKIKDKKIFCLFNLDKSPDEPFINVKCHPILIPELREIWDCVLPGWHQDKKHWISIQIKQIPDWLVKQLIDHSYQLIVKKGKTNLDEWRVKFKIN